MTTYGLTATGFVSKTAAVIEAEISAAQRAAPALGANWDTSAESPQGQQNGIMAAKLAELWELGEALYNARRPRGATGQALDDVSEITDTLRAVATKGTVTLRVNLDGGVTLPLGNAASVAGQPTNLWVTTAPAVNSSGSAANVYVAAVAAVAGPVIANSGTITVIATPYTGWNSVTNVLDAVPGQPADGDPALRDRREAELSAAGSSPTDALRAKLMLVPGVVQAVVFPNDTDTTDADGIPPHAIECLVQGGTDLAVAQAIWDGKAAGIATHGTTSKSVVDSAGIVRWVQFTRPTDLDVWVFAWVWIDSTIYAGADALKAAILAYGDTLLAGGVCKVAKVIGAAMGVAGVTDFSLSLPQCGLSLTSSPSDALPENIVPTMRQTCKLDSARIFVSVA